MSKIFAHAFIILEVKEPMNNLHVFNGINEWREFSWPIIIWVIVKCTRINRTNMRIKMLFNVIYRFDKLIKYTKNTLWNSYWMKFGNQSCYTVCICCPIETTSYYIVFYMQIQWFCTYTHSLTQLWKCRLKIWINDKLVANLGVGARLSSF